MKINNFNCLSLFDGISACQQAFKNLGIEFDGVNNQYFASEIDRYAIQVTQKNFPNTIQLGDVKKINYNKKDKILYYESDEYCDESDTNYKYYCPETTTIDLLCAGFPCQDLSCAKKDGKGLDGERSGLFYELLKIIREVKPKHILIENVASMKKEWKEKISQELGFGFTEINSSLLTAQQRKRVYWVASLQEDGTYKKVEIEQPQDKGVLLRDILESGETDKMKSYCIDASYYKGINLEQYLEKSKRQQVFEPVVYSPYNQTVNKEGKAYSLRTNPHCQTAVAGQLVLAPIRLGHLNKGGQGDRIYSVEGKSVSLSANGGGRGAKTGLYKIDLPDGEYSVRKLTVNECCRLQGFPDNFCDNVSKSQGYKALGNSFTVPVIEHILSSIFF